MMPPDQDSFSSSRVASGITLFAICLLGLMLRIHEMDRISYWFDESSSWKTIQFSWKQMIASVSSNVHPPFFYVMLKLWGNVFGTGPVALRGFSIAFGVGAIPALALFTRESLRGNASLSDFTQASTPLCAALLIATSPMHIMLSAQARMYSLGVFLALVAAYFLLRVHHSNSGRFGNQLGFAVCTTLLTLTHYYGLLTACAFELFVVGRILAAWKTKSAEDYSKWTSTIVVSLIALGLPWSVWFRVLLTQYSQVRRDYWILPLEWADVRDILYSMLGASGILTVSAVSDSILLFVTAAVMVKAVASKGVPDSLCVCAALFPMAVAVGASLMGKGMLVERYLLFAETFLLAAFALAIARVAVVKISRVLLALAIVWGCLCSHYCIDHRSRLAETSQLRDACLLAGEWAGEESIIWVGASMVHPTVQRYVEHSERVYVVDHGEKYRHWMGGPLLRPEEYLSADRIATTADQRIILVDVRLFYRNQNTDLGSLLPGWTEYRHRWFAESFGHSCQILVREFRRGVLEKQRVQMLNTPDRDAGRASK